MAAGSLAMVALAAGIQGRPQAAAGDTQTLRQALTEARRHPGYLYLTAGFFVCGWHVAFIAVHLPAYLADHGLSTQTAAWCLALIGLFNVIGSYVSGLLGGRLSKKYCLSFLYTARAILIAVFIAVPLSAASALIFSAIMGLLWLSTVPLTSGLVAQIFGPRYMATLFGFVFLGHQLGSFLGRLARRLALRPLRQLRPRLVALDRARPDRSPPPLADRRTRGRPPAHPELSACPQAAGAIDLPEPTMFRKCRSRSTSTSRLPRIVSS